MTGETWLVCLPPYTTLALPHFRPSVFKASATRVPLGTLIGLGATAAVPLSASWRALPPSRSSVLRAGELETALAPPAPSVMSHDIRQWSLEFLALMSPVTEIVTLPCRSTLS